jgi:Heparinase II/III-like protein/Heparinase II/III N-terminus
MQSLQWYVNRLGRMSPSELTYRVAQAAKVTTHRWAGLDQRAAPEPHAGPTGARFVHKDVYVDATPYIAQAEAIMAGRYQIFDLENRDLGALPEWNRDPLTGRLAPLLHAASLDYRDEQLVGNIKYLWEPNRHLHLPQLAQAYALTDELRYAHAVRDQVSSWITQCPCGRGPNWSSCLELAIRLINWSITWQLLGGFEAPLFRDAEGRRFRDQWLRSIYQHARAISGRLSRFSSANNHLIGEAAGVWIASLTWNYWPRMRYWGLRCKTILENEALTQNATDGGNREQAFAYQQFVLDFLLLAGLAARGADDDFSVDYWNRILGMLEFIAAMMDAGGNVPMVGDADDGYVARLSPEPWFDNYHSLLATGAVLFDRADFAHKAGPIDDKTRWLLGANAIAQCSHEAAARRSAETPRAFPQSGYYLLGSAFDTPDEVRMLIDAGPLGYLSIAAHGHADALSVVLSIAGREILVDPGTYAYHTEPQWRSYFRSTRAHNTALVDDQDQSRQVGNFMWSRHAGAKCLLFNANGIEQRFAGEHDGYESLSDPLTHRREITYDTARRTFEFTDVFECEAAHRVCLSWHFAESAEPVAHGDELQVRAGRYLVRIIPVDRPAHVHVFRGGDAMQGGWISRRFGCKAPTTTVVWQSHIHGTTQLRTRIECEAVWQPGAGA